MIKRDYHVSASTYKYDSPRRGQLVSRHDFGFTTKSLFALPLNDICELAANKARAKSPDESDWVIVDSLTRLR